MSFFTHFAEVQLQTKKKKNKKFWGRIFFKASVVFLNTTYLFHLDSWKKKK